MTAPHLWGGAYSSLARRLGFIVLSQTTEFVGYCCKILSVFGMTTRWQPVRQLSYLSTAGVWERATRLGDVDHDRPSRRYLRTLLYGAVRSCRESDRRAEGCGASQPGRRRGRTGLDEGQARDRDSERDVTGRRCLRSWPAAQCPAPRFRQGWPPKWCSLNRCRIAQSLCAVRLVAWLTFGDRAPHGLTSPVYYGREAERCRQLAHSSKGTEAERRWLESV